MKRAALALTIGLVAAALFTLPAGVAAPAAACAPISNCLPPPCSAQTSAAICVPVCPVEGGPCIPCYPLDDCFPPCVYGHDMCPPPPCGPCRYP